MSFKKSGHKSFCFKKFGRSPKISPHHGPPPPGGTSCGTPPKGRDTAAPPSGLDHPLKSWNEDSVAPTKRAGSSWPVPGASWLDASTSPVVLHPRPAKPSKTTCSSNSPPGRNHGERKQNLCALPETSMSRPLNATSTTGRATKKPVAFSPTSAPGLQTSCNVGGTTPYASMLESAMARTPGGPIADKPAPLIVGGVSITGC
jgi:hypothetical protein